MRRQARPARVNPAPAGARALGRLPPGTMNGYEAEYADELDRRLADGTVLWWQFEGMKFRLAPNTFYTPDFNVMLANGQVEHHEVKGHWEDDARVKIKVAASIYPFVFLAVKPIAKKHGGGWSREVFP